MKLTTKARTVARLYCWVCDTPFLPGDRAIACPHPNDDGLSETMSLMAWHPEHEIPIEASEDQKMITVFYADKNSAAPA